MVQILRDSALNRAQISAGVSNHNDLSGLQGGTTDEYYHLTAAEHEILTTGLQTFSCPIYQPHLHEAIEDRPVVFYIDSDQFGSGITITEVRLATNASSTYSLPILSMASPTDGSPTTIGTVATSSSTEATITPAASIAAGRYIGLDLPTTSIGFILVQIWFERN